MNSSVIKGVWQPEMYAYNLPDEIAFDESLLKFTIQVCQPKTALDIGCGLGYFVKYLRNKGVDAWGIEGSDLGSLFQAPGYQIKQDITQPFDLKKKSDLVMCLEVFEHIPQELEDIVFDNIVRHTSKYLLFSSATPEQQGTSQVNDSLENYWFSHLIRRGLSLRHVETLNARLCSTLSWYARSVSLWEITNSGVSDSHNIIAEKDNQILKCLAVISQLNLKLDQTIKSMTSAKVLADWLEKGCPAPPPHIHKQNFIQKYAQEYNLKIFVETGTFHGDMIEAVKDSFELIYSIELSHDLHKLAQMRFRGQDKIKLIKGDSAQELDSIMKQLKQPALFWLDGHYSAGTTARGEKDIPILEELDCILSYPDIGHVLIIDDPRCFGTDPAYPTINALKSFILNKRDSVEITVQDDSIRIVPTK